MTATRASYHFLPTDMQLELCRPMLSQEEAGRTSYCCTTGPKACFNLLEQPALIVCPKQKMFIVLCSLMLR